MSNEITVDFETGEIVEDEHMKYIDYVFNNMNKTDAKEAMKELIGMTKEAMKECEDSVKQMYENYMEMYKNYMEIINFLEACGLLKK